MIDPGCGCEALTQAVLWPRQTRAMIVPGVVGATPGVRGAGPHGRGHGETDSSGKARARRLPGGGDRQARSRALADPDAAQIAFKRSVDPHLLMNPGKVAGLNDLPDGLSGAALEAAQLPASGWAY